MPRRLCLLLLTAIALLSLVAGDLTGQEISNNQISLLGQNEAANFVYRRGPGAYLSWIKLLMVIGVFILWVRMADWLNRDAMKIGELTKLKPEVWNPIMVLSFLVGFFCAISIPYFTAGYSVYVFTALVPFALYFFLRRTKMKANANIKHQLRAKPGEAPEVEALPQDEGVLMDFNPAGADKKEKQVNLIRARQSAGFIPLKDMIDEALLKRADVVMLDFTRDRVNCRLQVDSVWHPLAPLDRAAGDAVLVSLKSLAGLNANERRAKQTGRFSIKTEDEKANIEVSSQGVATGERAQFKFLRQRKEVFTLGQLGMFPGMVESLQNSLNRPGVAIISAPPQTGLTSSWRGALVTADRLTRDCTAVIADDESETDVANIVLHRYGAKSERDQMEALKALLLSQPDMVAVPTIEEKPVLDELTKQALTQERSVILRTGAKSASEALLRLMAQAGDREQFISALGHVTCQRLIRRLCDDCKQEVPVRPKFIQQLGGDSRKQTTVFNPFKLPPPDQRVDEKGREIEFPVCQTCGGIGYVGRIAVFEMIIVEDTLRETLRKSPKLENVEKTAIAAGKAPLMNQAYKLVLLGITSLAEVQRVLAPKQKKK